MGTGNWELMEISKGDRIIAEKNGKKIRGNVRAQKGSNIHVFMDGRMYLITTADIISVNGKKYRD
jgi:hypothetical protein